MTTKFLNNSFISLVSYKSLNHGALRAVLVMLLFVLGIGNAWGYSYYSQFTAKSGNSAQGLVYAAGDNSEGGMSDYTNQVTPDKHAKSSSGGEYTWYAWAKAARGYKFKTWTKGSNINSSGSLTSAATTFGVNHSSLDDGTTSGDATATFEGDTPYTITFKKPENFGAYTAEYENYTISSNKFVEYSKTITMTSSSANTNETSYASDKITLKATARVANFIGWYNGSTLLSTSADGYTFSPRAAMTVEGRWEEVVTHLNMTFKAVELDDSDNPKGSYTVGGTTVSTSDVVVNTGDLYYLETTLTATPATGYVFTGWYTKDGKKKNFISYDNPFNAYFDQETTVYASFTYSNYSDDQKAQFKVGSTYYTDLNAANTAAVDGSNKTIVCTRDGVLPPGNYTISSGVSLLIPYSTSETVQTTPAVVTTAVALSANRTLTFTDGANVVCNGEICVGGQIMSANGGKPSAYPTGACGVIDMSKGGHIELNNKAVLYAWGFVKGQDMDQGNNTLEVGTITANSGAVVWEDFAVGDWRGGSACLTIWSNRSSWKFFPFQSYTVQNVEVPTTYKYGSTLSNYTNVYGDGSTNAGKFAIIGKENTLFLLKDSKSLVRKWYDPTTDLVCYEMSGTTQLNALNVDVDITTVNSSEYNLPLSSSMHIILTNCNTTISKPMVMQAGAVVEVKPDATLTLSDKVYLFDKDNWGEYCYKKYYYTMANLTNHKNRGNGTSNELIDDAKLIIDGTLNVTGKMYTTAGGADIMSNGGGVVTFSSLPTATSIVMCTGVSDNENVAVASANLHNEDDSYTQVRTANSTFHNVNGRWFVAADKDEKENHTYNFTYITSGAVSGTGGVPGSTPAVYSWDKTGLELRQKWFNVTEDCNENGHYWWHGQGEQSSWFYNWTLNSDWHQFMPTATEGMYSGSNNKIYTKTDCDWEELGEADVNCLYEIGGVKKALVDGQFIALEPNNNDPAYHAADDATKYYICFSGCNWHEATKYENAEKAYIIEPDTFVWYNNAWMSVNFKEPFAYTIDETNVPVYYEYVDGEWVLAEPYVRVVDGTENRTYWFLKDAFTFANSVLRTAPTITILRDISGITTAVSYTGANKTCTLDLNGHSITGSVSSMLTINGAGCTFIIEDNNTEGKEGKINLYYSYNGRRYAVNVTKGHLKLKSGTISSINTLPYATGQTSTTSCAIIVKASQQCTIEGGKVYAQADHNPFGIYGDGNSSTITVKGGEVIASVGAKSEPRGIQVTGGTLNVQGGTIEATTHSSGTTGEGIYVNSAASYFATLNMTGGTVKSTTKTSSIGILVNYNYTYDTNQPRNITAQSLPVANIFGGEIQVMNANGATAEGVRSFGTTNISGGKITVRPTTTTAFGVRLYAGKTTISGTADIDVAATSTAYGVRISQENPYKTGGLVYNGTLEMTGGTLTVRTSSTTDAYGVYVGAGSLAQTHANDPSNSTYKSYYAGNYANAGAATISGGVIDVQAKTNKAYAVYVAEPVSQSGAEGYQTATATPNCSITGGKFKVASMTPSATDIAATNVSTSTYTISGGYYNNQENVEGYTSVPKHVVELPTTDANYPEYLYKVANSYLVTFKNESESLQSTYQEEGEIPTYTGAEPTKASAGGYSYEFDGWSTTNGGAPAALTAVTSAGATYYAHFAETDLRYTISLNSADNGGECAQEYIRVAPGSAAGTLPSATKEGHTFTGWFTAASGGTQLTASTVVSGDITYYAQFSVNSYTLTYELGEGKVTTKGTPIPAKNMTGTQSKSVAYGTAITAPVVTRTGYTFQSWDAIIAPTMPAENVAYTPLWIPNVNTKYTVKHYLQNVDGTYPADPVESQSLNGTTATSVTPAVKSYEGFISPATQTATIAADGSLVIEYRYARQTYTISLDAYTNGGTSDAPDITIVHGATIGAVPPDAQKGCNDFTGWYTKPVGGVKITPEFVIEYDMKTLYAQFSDDVRTYPITYNAGANGTGTVAGGTKTCGVNTTLSSSTFTRTDYTQTGWSLTDGGAQAYALGGTYTANASLTLYPVWTAVTYNLTYEGLNGATNSNPVTYTIETATITLANPGTRAGYTFTDWTCGGNPITQIALGSTGDKTITANWSAVTYNLTYEGLNGATNSNPATYTIETATITLANPGTRAGYTFTGWTCGGSPITQIALGSTGDKVITANWEKIGVTILWKSEDGESTLETDEGVEIDATPSFNGETPTKITTAEYTYTFDGWTTEANGAGTFYAIGELPAVAAAATYYAHFTATPNVASVTTGGVTTYYTSFKAAFNYAKTATTATLTVLADNNDLDEALTYNPSSSEAVLTIDLNGYSTECISISGSEPALMDINKVGARVIIQDNSASENGILKICTSGNPYGIRVIRGILELQSGTIHAESTNSALYGLIKISNASSSFIMSGGKAIGVSKNWTYGIINSGTVTISGGEINLTGVDNTYGLHLKSGTCTISGSPAITTTTGNNAWTVCAEGGTAFINETPTISATATGQAARAVYALSSGSVTVNGGTFSATAPAGKQAYDIYAESSSTININSGKFTCSSVPVYSNSATLNIYGGYFNEYSGTSSYDNLDAACVAPKHPLTLTSAEKAVVGSDYEYKIVDAYTITFVDGNGNTLQTDYIEDGDTPVYSGSTPTKTADASYIYTFTGWSPAITAATADATYTAQFSTTPTVASVTTGGVTTYYTSFKAAFNYAKTATTATLTVLADNNDLDEALTYNPSSSEAVLTIDLNGYSTECISISGSEPALMDINKVGARVIIQDNSASENGILKICTSGNPYGIRVIRGILELQSGTIHAESTNSALYGLIKISNASSSFIMSGGKAIGVSKNWTYGIINSGTVTISGGEINLTGVDNTYGLHLKSGTCTISGSPAITTTTGNNAWTVCAEGGTAFINETPTISATATGQAARAVYALSSGSVTVNGGTFSATAPAGKQAYDIYAESSSTININSGKFTCSSVPVYSNSATLNIYGGYFNEYSGTSSYDNLDAACVAPKHPLTLTSAEKAVVGSDYEYKIVDAYTITFVDGNGNTLQTDYIEDGDTPVYSGSTPTKTADASYIYTFTGWSPAITAATADATYTAQFSTTPTVASVTVGGATTYYSTIDAAWAFVNEQSANTTIKLLQDATAEASLVFTPAAAMTCTLDLNNHTISGSFTKVINVNLQNATLTITDNSAEKGGKIITEQSLNGKLYGLYITAGKANLNAGTIECINTMQYNSSSAKSVAAYGVYVYKSSARYFTMNGGTVKANATYNVFGVYSAGTTKLQGGKIIVSDAVTGLTRNGTGYGVYVAAAKTTISGDADISVNTKTVAYGVYVNAAAATVDATGGVILAKTASSTKAYGVYVNNGTFNAPEGSTTSITADAYSTTGYAIVTAASGTANIYDGTFEAKTTKSTGTTTSGVYSSGTTNIHGGTFTVSANQSTARAIVALRNTTTVDGNPVFNVSAPTIVYGATASGTTPKAADAGYCGTLKVYGGTFNVTATKTTTAYGVYAYAGTGFSMTEEGGTIEKGNYINAGTVEVYGGEFNVKAKTTDAYGVFVNEGTQTNADAGEPKTAYGQCSVTGGKFKVETTGDANATAYATNTTATAENLTVQGGWYNTKRTDASTTSVIEDKYTQPAKTSVNYWVLPLTGEDPYLYEVAEAYTVTFDANGHGEAPSAQVVKKNQIVTKPAAPTAEGWNFEGWYKESGCTNAWNFSTDVITAATILYAKWTSAETGFYVDIVDVDNSAKTLTLNVTGWASSGWPYTINDVEYQKTARETDRTLIIPYTGNVGESMTITVQKTGGDIVSKHNYIVPAAITGDAALGDQQMIFVKPDVTLIVEEDKTTKNIYVAPGAKLVVNAGVTLKADTVFLRTTPWASAELELDGTITGQVCYTRIISKKDQYYQFGLPMPCKIANVRLSDGTKPVYGNGWLLRSYSESSRAQNGTGTDIDNWVTLTSTGSDDAEIQGRTGYEMFSNSGYYREYYFPVDHTDLASTVDVTRTTENTKGETHEGWNIKVSPLMRKYTVNPAPEGWAISWLQEDGTYSQEPADIIQPAIPFSYQAKTSGSITFGQDKISIPTLAPRRRVAAMEEPTRIQWIHLDVKNINGVGDQTSIYSHPTRYEQTYKTGIDVAKQSLTASRAIIYSSHAYGDMAFAGVADSLLESGVALTVYSPAAQELTFSLRDNDWLNRMESVWLIDKEESMRIDLLNGYYTFNASEGTTRGRFFIQGQFKAPNVATELEPTSDSSLKGREIRKVIINQKMFIEVNGRLYDATGKEVKR